MTHQEFQVLMLCISVVGLSIAVIFNVLLIRDMRGLPEPMFITRVIDACRWMKEVFGRWR